MLKIGGPCDPGFFCIFGGAKDFLKHVCFLSDEIFVTGSETTNPMH